MSLSNNTHIENPCKKWIEYKAENKQWIFYNKALEQNEEIKHPKFVVLDELSTVVGWYEAGQSGIYSNEVHNLSEQILKVKSWKGGLELVGYYKDIKPSLISSGGKFAKSVYALLVTETGYELVNFKLKGVGFGGWMDKKFNPLGKIVSVTDYIAGKKGRSEYFTPVFSCGDALQGEDLEYAIGVDKELQEYFKSYEKKSPANVPEVVKDVPPILTDLEKTIVEEIGGEIETENLPF